jgi:hypothetical protein
MRLLLILLLTAAMDLGSPVLPGGEGLEEFEEAAHGRRRLARLASVALPKTVAVPDPSRLHTVTPPAVALTPPVPLVAPRKLPPRQPDRSPASPDDH